MKQTEYEVIFVTGKNEFELAAGIKEAIILAQACQIKKGNNYTVSCVVDVETQEVIFQPVLAVEDAQEQTVSSDRATRCVCGNIISPNDKCEGCAGLV